MDPERNRAGLVLAFCVLCLIVLSAIPGLTAPPDSDMVFVQGGAFRMGNIFSEGQGDSDEQPPHDVRVNSFWMSDHELTVAEFRAFVEATGYVTSAEINKNAQIIGAGRMLTDTLACWNRLSFAQDDDHPVVGVSWLDTVAYCNWRSESAGLTPCYSGTGAETACDFSANGYRLPTEAEWEYAARSGGKANRYAWGDGDPMVDGRQADNLRDESWKRTLGAKTYWEGYDDGWVFTAPVKAFAPNELGLYSMSGNVYEWVWDWYDTTYYAVSPVDNPTGPPTGEIRSCRSAGYTCLPMRARTVNRGRGAMDLAFLHGGFRVARSAAKD